LIPKDNEKDIEDIPESVRHDLTFHAVSHMDEVLKYALVYAAADDKQPLLKQLQMEDQQPMETHH
jgi:ATP-dependent Lon protease